MAEETVKRVTGLNPLFQAMSEMSTVGMPSFDGSPSDVSADASIPVQEDPKQLYCHQSASNNHLSTHEQRVQNAFENSCSVAGGSQKSSSTDDKLGRAESMQRVASLEHLQKRIRGGNRDAGGR